MPAFMTIGKFEDWEVIPGEILGDATTWYRERWMHISSFSVDMKDDARASRWDAKATAFQAGSTKKKKKKKKKSSGGRGGSGAEAGEEEEREGPKQNTLSVTKPTDSASTKILEWAQNPIPQDIQIDCQVTEEDWPFLCMIFIGAVPLKADFEDDPSDSLEFSWQKAIVYTLAFDEQNNPEKSDFAEFGEEVQSSSSTSADERGIATFTAPTPDPTEGAGRGGAATTMVSALDGTSLPTVPQETETYDQERRSLLIEKVGDLEFNLESFRGEERISSLFVFDLELRSIETAIAAKDIVGHEISWRLEDEEGQSDYDRPPRYFHGVVSSFLVGEMASDARRRYHATVVPKLWRLTQRSDCRVWQGKNVKEVVEDVFKEASFTDYDMAAATKTPPPMEYCVQYQETDFAFVSRLLEEHGIFYYFKFEDGKHTMMLCDGSTGYVPFEGDALRFAHDAHRDPVITSWRRHFAMVPGAFDSRDWNFTTPKEPIKGEATTKIDLPEIDKGMIFEYPGEYVDNDLGTTIADRRLQEREVGHDFVHAVSCYDGLTPCTTFSLSNAPGEPEDGPTSKETFLVTGMRHRAEQQPEYGTSIVGYGNTFTCIPDTVPYMPARKTPRPRILGPQTAIVVGDKESTEELVDTDKYGRVKVQFHWDRKGKKDTDSSAWLRCAQVGGGAGYGGMIIPRIGWEVVVSFLNGDPDRPLVTGVVVNELHMPYHELPAAKHKSVFMTRSFPDGGKENFNELTFHDEKDKEEIYFHAERDFKRVVEHDDVLEIGEKEDGGQTITIEGNQTLTINKGNREKKIVEGTETISVKGDRSTTIESGGDTLTVSSGDHKIDVSSGKIEISAGTSIELKVGGNTIKIEASGITMTVGGSKVEVTNSGVAIKGMEAKVEGTMSAEVKGTMCKIAGDGMLETKGGITMMQ